MPGWDGRLFSDQGNAWVPVGASCWEVGCEQQVSGKANGDYRKRTVETGTQERASTTFVFVTPRRWSGKSAWVKTQCNLVEWADVRAYDADDLEQWLEQSPVVALRFAEELGLLGPGVESLDRYWLLWAQQCNPSITLEAFFTDRAEARNRLLARARTAGQESSQPLTLCADSVEEAAAFAAATVLEQPELADQALVVVESDGWRFVEANPQLRIAIAARTEVAAHPTQRDGLLVIVPHVSGDLSDKAQGLEQVLDRPNIYDFEKALVAMGMEESDAKRYALSTGRSWSVLRRRRAINPAIQHPAWLDTAQAASLVTVCLLGAWNSDKEGDRQIVARVAGRPYEEIESDLHHLAQLDDAPILHIGAVSKAKSPLELLSLFGNRITRSQLDRFFEVARERLGATDPQLELPDDQRYAAQVYGKVQPQSGLLFDSLCDALIKLAVHGPDQTALLALDIEGRVAKLVHDLLEGVDETRWLSLASYLPALAEAAPDSFLRAIERSLCQTNPPVARLILETTDAGFGGRCWHAGLLWALETLAWAPKRLARVALILARLTHVPYNNRWSNTPGRSLLGLFRAWLPQTAAELPQRLQVLDLIVQRYPDAAFDVLDGITERGQQTATPANRPKWRDDDAGSGNGVPHGEQLDMVLAAREHMVRLSAGHAERIVRLFNNTNLSDRESMIVVLDLMQPYTLADARDEDREILRAALRNCIHWHRNYDNNQGAELESRLALLDLLYQKLEPADLVARHRWLFSSHWPDLPAASDHSDDKAALVTEARTSALDDIIRILGIVGIRRLVDECGEPYTVGMALAKQEDANGEWPAWIVEQGSDFMPASPTGQCITGLLRNLPEPRATALLRAVLAMAGEHGWNPERQARFLALASPARTTWDLAADRGPETDAAYWRCAPLNRWFRDWGEEAIYALHRLSQAQRPRTALQCCRFDQKMVDSRLLFVLLQQFMNGEEPEGPMPKSWDLANALEHIEQSGEVENTEVIRLEFGLFPALRLGRETHASALFEAVTSDPAIFTELITLLYKPEHGEREEPITEAIKAAASTAWEIFRSCKRQPGTQPDGSIDADAFLHFIDEARALCRKADRLNACEETLGEILAHAPADEHGAWPFAPARQVLDRQEMEEMRGGFMIGERNKHGSTSRHPWDGGAQERNLATYYRGEAEKLQHSHPQVAALLEALARSYEHDGLCEDNQASLRKEKY